MNRPSITLRVKRLDPSVTLPSYAYEGDAGLDLCASEDVTLAPYERTLIPTGLALAIPDGCRNNSSVHKRTVVYKQNTRAKPLLAREDVLYRISLSVKPARNSVASSVLVDPS